MRYTVIYIDASGNADEYYKNGPCATLDEAVELARIVIAGESDDSRQIREVVILERDPHVSWRVAKHATVRRAEPVWWVL